VSRPCGGGSAELGAKREKEFWDVSNGIYNPIRRHFLAAFPFCRPLEEEAC